MPLPCLESQGCHLISFFFYFYFFFFLVFFFFFRKLKYVLLGVRLFCVALVEQLGDDSWYVVCANCCHMALVFAIMQLCNCFIFVVVSVHSFLKIFFFNIDGWNVQWYQHVLALCVLLTGVVLKGLTLKICVWCLCMYDLFSVCIGNVFVDWLEKRFMYEKSFEMCICLWQSLVVLRWPSVVDRTLKPSY